MADGTIQISVEVDGKQIPVAGKALDDLAGSAKDSGQGLKGAEDGVKGVGDNSEKAGLSIKKVATALGLVAVASVAFKVLRDAVGEAVSRFDTLERFPKVLQSLGVEADDSERAMSRLSEGIDGLPTKLDDIAQTAQRMYTSFSDMDLATDSALALNNALLGSGASADDAKRGTEMYLKALQTGKIDMVTWRTLSETMDVGLVKIAEGFGFAGKSAKDDLYAALQDGTISMDQFNDKMIELGTGTGIMAKLARENSEGIGNSFGNLRYAAAIGIANVIKSLDNLSKEVTGSTIAQNIDNMKGVIRTAFAVIVTTIDATTPAFKLLATVIGALLPVIRPLTPALIGLGVAFAIHATINALSNAIKANMIIQAAASAITNAYTVATSAQGRAMVLNGIQIKATGIILAIYNGIVALAVTVHGLLAGGLTLASVATGVFTAAVGLASTALQILMGPVGWVTLAIGLLVGAVIGIVAWFKRGTEEGARLKEETEAMAESADALTSSIDSNSKAHEESLASIASSSEANKGLAEDIENLADKENKSAAEKELLRVKVEQLNGEVEDLGLAYNAESDALNLSNEEIKGRIDLLAEQTAFNEGLERQLEISKEQHEVDSKLDAITALKKTMNEQVREGTITTGEFSSAQKELNETEQNLMITKGLLAEEQKIVEAQIVASQKAMAESTVGATQQMIQAFDEMYESNAATIDSLTGKYEEMSDMTSNAFDRMSDKSKLTSEEMIANMEHNAEMTAQWGNNVAELHEKAGSESSGGFLRWLDEMGPESAAELQVVNDMSDAELKKFIQLMDESGDVATEALKTALGGGYDETVDVVATKTELLNQTTRDGLEAGNYSELGYNMPSQTADGVNEGSPLVESAAEKMGVGAQDSVKKILNPEEFKAIGQDVAKGTAEGVDAGAKEVSGATEKMGVMATDSVKSILGIQSPSTVFKAIGGDMTDGLAIGITQGTSEVMSAITSMFKSVQTASTTSFNNLTKGYEQAVSRIMTTLMKLNQQTQQNMMRMNQVLKMGAMQQMNSLRIMDRNYSLSVGKTRQSFMRLNMIVISGMSMMVSSLRSGSFRAESIMQLLSIRLMQPFNTFHLQFSAIGNSAMNGLNSGLIAGSHRVMSTARSIASSVASTMRKALKINSPSRLMRDEVGISIPEGVADGIVKGTRGVDKAMAGLIGGVMAIGTPEMALGTGRMAYSGTGSQSTVNSVTNYNQTKQEDNKQPAVINVHVGSKKIANEIVEDITKLQNERTYSNNLARRRG